MNKDIFYEEIWELVSKVIDKIRHSDDGDFSVGIIAKYPEAKEIIKEFVMCDTDIDTIELEHPDVDGYEDEYYIVVSVYGGEISISCFQMVCDEEYYDVDNNIIYVFEDCNSRALKHCAYDEMYFMYAGEDDECDCECCGCCEDEKYIECSKSYDGDIHGFTASKSTDNGYHSYSFYTSDALSKSDIHDILKEFGF